ncbi:hypothetical protein NDU88_005497 [Pleurodeles waltl]|uniref:Uncharacterized protein n=1 Tax=Pleurodeles waltl TaxID=8319 RepID=A0AAV7LPQ7_PLEWA|nr:hypothetical protein NDU88_005497 [Pleurodeles waltl]
MEGVCPAEDHTQDLKLTIPEVEEVSTGNLRTPPSTPHVPGEDAPGPAEVLGGDNKERSRTLDFLVRVIPYCQEQIRRHLDGLVLSIPTSEEGTSLGFSFATEEASVPACPGAC